MPSRHIQRRGKNFSKLSNKKAKKYYKFTEPPQPDRFADTEGDYWYEETEGTIGFIDPVEHCDYESSEEEEEEDGEDDEVSRRQTVVEKVVSSRALSIYYEYIYYIL